MKTLRFLGAFTLLLTGVLALRCSLLSPLVGGGTETGNPGMVLCGVAVFNETDTSGRWQPGSYIPGGDAQLNPDPERLPVVPLKKAGTVKPDTQVIIKRDSAIVIKIISRTDTVEVVDTVFIRDTVINESIVHDTIPDTSGQIIMIMTIDRKVFDTVLKVDTVVNRTTVIKPRVDTLYFRMLDPVNNPDSVQLIAINPRIVISIGVPNPIRSIFTTPSPSLNYVSVSHTATINGTTATEEYTDGDHDGYLLKQLPDQPARVKFNGWYTNGTQKATLSFLFDAGADRSLGKTADNRVLGLSRKRVHNGMTVEEVTYAIPQVDSAQSRSVLTVERYFESGEISDSRVWYRYCGGQRDQLDHRGLKPRSISQDNSYRVGKVRSIQIDISLDTTRSVAAILNRNDVSATMYYVNGMTGKFSGKYDRKSGKMSGVYTENGYEYPVIYYNDRAMLSWEEDLEIVVDPQIDPKK